MTLMTASNLSKSFGGNVIFDDVSFVLPTGGRVGLIGPNGSGKTTFFKVLAGEEEYEGDFSRRRGLEIARLEQSPTFPSGSTARTIMSEAVGHWQDLDQAIDDLHSQLADLPGEDQAGALKRLADLEARREAGGGESALRRAFSLLHGVGLNPEQWDQDIDTLSGGERCRVALARLLVNEPDLWLLDEPTNHLDLAGIAFLERFLRSSQAASIIVSHDRRFLDQVTGETWEMESGTLLRYPGNYSRSRRLREERRLAQWREFMKQRDFMRKEEMFINKWRAGTRSRQAQSRMKRLAKVELVDEPQNQARLAALNLGISRRLGDFVLETDNLAVGYPGRTLFSGLTLTLAPGEIVGVVGPNGAGKTSLFQTLLGALPPVDGAFRWGPTAELGMLGQHEIFPDPERTPLQYLQDHNLGCDDQDRRDKLGAMLFSGDEVYKPVRVLSGGEKKRLMQTRLLLEGHNVLLLDEPTNHLDIQSAEAVTLALSAYPGTVVTISHDRYFLDEVADRVLWLEQGEWRLTRGGFDEADAKRAEEQSKKEAERDSNPKRVAAPAANPGGTPARSGARSDGDGDRPYAAWRTNKIEARIIANEERMGEIHSAFGAPAVVRDGNPMRQLQNEVTRLEEEQALLEAEYSDRS
ncbi:MAG: ATP-binding cassette domain-containing protein [Planctomycetes bacterium]|nr:ATP-binding cassette domain-containing protein [Planctomycetota bacterium]